MTFSYDILYTKNSYLDLLYSTQIIIAIYQKHLLKSAINKKHSKSFKG